MVSSPQHHAVLLEQKPSSTEEKTQHFCDEGVLLNFCSDLNLQVKEK